MEFCIQSTTNMHFCILCYKALRHVDSLHIKHWIIRTLCIIYSLNLGPTVQNDIILGSPHYHIIHPCPSTYPPTHTRTRIHTYIHTRTHTHTHTQTHTRTHTHHHTHTPSHTTITHHHHTHTPSHTHTITHHHHTHTITNHRAHTHHHTRNLLQPDGRNQTAYYILYLSIFGHMFVCA